jgi:hypothetical protein
MTGPYLFSRAGLAWRSTVLSDRPVAAAIAACVADLPSATRRARARVERQRPGSTAEFLARGVTRRGQLPSGRRQADDDGQHSRSANRLRVQAPHQ